MPLVFPDPFPNETAKDVAEAYRFGQAFWRRAQKFRAGQFAWAPTVTAGTVLTKTFTDVSVGGTDTGVDNTVAGMFVAITPPAAIPTQLKIDYTFVAAAGTLTVQLRNDTGGDLSVSGTWSYFGYTF